MNGVGGCCTYLVMQIHHEWVLVGRVSSWVKHSWRRAGKSVGAGLIYRDVRLLGEGRVHLGLILAQQGCQRSVASSPLTPSRGAVGPSQERNRAGVTPRPEGHHSPRQDGLQEDQCRPSAQGETLRALCQVTSGAEQLQNHFLCSPCKCPLRVRSIKRTPAPQGPLIWARWMCFPVNVPPSPTGSRCLAPEQDQRTSPTCTSATGDRAPHHTAPRTFAGGGRGCCRVPPRNGAGQKGQRAAAYSLPVPMVALVTSGGGWAHGTSGSRQGKTPAP